MVFGLRSWTCSDDWAYKGRQVQASKCKRQGSSSRRLYRCRKACPGSLRKVQEDEQEFWWKQLDCNRLFLKLSLKLWYNDFMRKYFSLIMMLTAFVLSSCFEEQKHGKPEAGWFWICWCRWIRRDYFLFRSRWKIKACGLLRRKLLAMTRAFHVLAMAVWPFMASQWLWDRHREQSAAIHLSPSQWRGGVFTLLA